MILNTILLFLILGFANNIRTSTSTYTSASKIATTTSKTSTLTTASATTTTKTSTKTTTTTTTLPYCGGIVGSIRAICNFSFAQTCIPRCFNNLQCIKGICDCPANLTWNGGDQCISCKAPVSIDLPCQANCKSPCLSNLQCITGTCKCPSSSIWNGFLCQNTTTTTTTTQTTSTTTPSDIVVIVKKILTNFTITPNVTRGRSELETK